MFLDHPITETQAKSRSLAHVLRGKKRIEYFGKIFLIDAGAIVLKGNSANLTADFGRDANRTLGLVAFNCLPRIVDNIEEDLLYLMGIDHCLRQMRVQAGGDFDIARPQLVLKKFDRALDQFVDARELSLGSSAPREAQ